MHAPIVLVNVRICECESSNSDVTSFFLQVRAASGVKAFDEYAEIVEEDDDTGDYSQAENEEYELNREQITLTQILGKNLASRVYSVYTT